MSESEAPGAPDVPREIVETTTTADGHELVLARRGGRFEIVYDGHFLMASDARGSEESLADLGLAQLSQRTDITVLVGGLGMGLTLRRVLDTPGVVRVDVVEIEPAIVEWNRKHFGDVNRGALADPRVHVHTGELMSFLKESRYAPIEEVKDGWFSLLLDVDNGPNWTVREANANIYGDEGLKRLEAALRPGGILGVWSAQRDVEFLKRMHARFQNVAEMAVPVDVEGKSSLDYIYRGRRRPEPKAAAGGGMAQA